VTLQEIGMKHQTDKAVNHHYLALYDALLMNLFPPRRLLEIGVQFGCSMRMWREYCGITSSIYGIDVTDNEGRARGDWELIIGDAYNPAMFTQFAAKSFDVIIDDGSHEERDQLFVASSYPQFLSQDGFLFIEDILEKSTVPKLAAVLPEDFDYTAVEMVEGTSWIVSRLFIAWKKRKNEHT
jgi:hypothetical protein